MNQALVGWGYREWSPAPVVRKDKQRAVVLESVVSNPGTSAEIATELGIPMRQCSAVLSSLYRDGLLKRTPWRRPNLRTTFIYSGAA